MPTTYTAAQKRAFAVRMAKKRAAAPSTRTRRTYYAGSGGYFKKRAQRRQARREVRTMSDGPFLGRVGANVGRALGGAVHGLFKKLTGFGDYKINHNTILEGTAGTEISVPEMHGRGASRVRHREYITDVDTTVDFTIKGYNINPADSATFPWLSSVASKYEQWKALGIVFEFVSTSSNALNSTNTALGSINMATQYNSLSPLFANKQEVLNYEFSVSTKPADSVCHPIECDPGETPSLPLYTRTASDALNPGDLRLYDLGRFSISSSGSQAKSVAGELWVTYDILLMKPKLGVPDGGSVMAHYYLSGGSAPMTGLLPFGPPDVVVDPVFRFPNEDGERIDIRVGTDQVVIPKGYDGNYSIQWMWNGGAYIPAAAFSATIVNATYLVTLQRSTTGFQQALDPTGAYFLEILIAVTDPALDVVITVSANPAVILPSAPHLDIIVTQLNGAYP